MLMAIRPREAQENQVFKQWYMYHCLSGFILFLLCKLKCPYQTGSGILGDPCHPPCSMLTEKQEMNTYTHFRTWGKKSCTSPLSLPTPLPSYVLRIGSIVIFHPRNLWKAIILHTMWHNTSGEPAGEILLTTVGTLSLPKVINFKIPASLTRNMTSQSMENLAFHSLLTWKMIILPILATSLIHFSKH